VPLIGGLRSMELNNCRLWSMEENKREERCREQREGATDFVFREC